MLADINKAAVLSNEKPEPLYRYLLSRVWGKRPMMVWIMLNPSTADHRVDDPTILACMDFARRSNCGGAVVLNLFAFRSPHPKKLLTAVDPVGPMNDAFIVDQLQQAKADRSPVIAAWGANGGLLNRDVKVRAMIAAAGVPLLCFGQTKDGHPKHPLARGLHRIPRDTKPYLLEAV